MKGAREYGVYIHTDFLANENIFCKCLSGNSAGKQMGQWVRKKMFLALSFQEDEACNSLHFKETRRLLVIVELLITLLPQLSICLEKESTALVPEPAFSY